MSDMDVPDAVFGVFYERSVLDLPYQYGISAACPVFRTWPVFS